MSILLNDAKYADKAKTILSGKGIEYSEGKIFDVIPETVKRLKLNGNYALLYDKDDVFNVGYVKKCLSELRRISFIDVPFSGRGYNVPTVQTVDKLKKCDYIVVIGDDVLINTGKYLSSVTGKKLIVVLTSPVAKHVFTDRVAFYNNGVKTWYKCVSPSIVVMDEDIISRSKKRQLSSGYTGVVCKGLSLIDYRFETLLYNTPLDTECYNLVVGGINAVLNVVSEDTAVKNLIKANLLIALSECVGEVAFKSSYDGVAYALSEFATGRSLEDLEFVAFTRILKFYKLYLENVDYQVLSVADYLKGAIAVEDILGIDRDVVLERLKVSGMRNYFPKKNTLNKQRKDLLSVVDGMLTLLGRFERVRTGLCQTAPKDVLKITDIKNAIYTGAYLSYGDGLFPLIRDEGYLEYVI